VLVEEGDDSLYVNTYNAEDTLLDMLDTQRADDFT